VITFYFAANGRRTKRAVQKVRGRIPQSTAALRWLIYEPGHNPAVFKTSMRPHILLSR